jgi:Mn2+/Fe2+ NRAMP family transporter
MELALLDAALVSCAVGTMAAQSVSQLESNPDLSHQQFVRGYSTPK